MTTPRILSSRRVYGFAVTRFQTRFGDIIWIVTDMLRSIAGSGVDGIEVYQGDRQGAKEALAIRVTMDR